MAPPHLFHHTCPPCLRSGRLSCTLLLCPVFGEYYTHPEIADVSIVDHLKSSSAIAACLYQYHSSTNTLQVKNIKRDDQKKFLLVGGNLSGIQRYIYQISAITGEGGVAKRLRARSFYISALLEVAIVKILSRLGLPISCNMMSAGGKFIILAPNTEVAKERLADLYKEMSDWFLEEFSGELALIIDWSTEIEGSDFYRRLDQNSLMIGEDGEEEREIDDEEDKTNEQRQCNFRDRVDEMHFAIEKQKLQRFKVSLRDDSRWFEDKFIRINKYKAYGKGFDDCRSCNKFPAEYKDPHNEDREEKVLCKKCAIDKIIGRKLLDAEFLAIGRDQSGERSTQTESAEPKNWDYFFFFDDYYFIQPLKNYRWDNDFLLLQQLRDHKHDEKAMTVYRFLANYTPTFERYSEKEEVCELCKEARPCEQIEMMKKRPSAKHLYTFSCIGAAGSEHTGKKGEYKGSQLVGVLKADIDNLGLIFSEGLENRLTISRYLTMSRMVDLFFSGWIYRILDKTPEYRKIYTIYSGGDDLVLVGPWERLIDFAKRIYEEFRRFTCNNENITLSAGLAVVHPKYPISAAVELADRYLEMSKASGKDRVTLFDTTIKWSEMEKLLIFKDTLNKGHEDFSNIVTTGFIHRLLTYQHMCLDARNGDIRKLIFHSHMHYDVRRNLKERIAELKDEEGKRWLNENIVPLMLKLYRTPVDTGIMDNLRIPVYWILYKNRRYRKGGE